MVGSDSLKINGSIAYKRLGRILRGHSVLQCFPQLILRMKFPLPLLPTVHVIYICMFTYGTVCVFSSLIAIGLPVL